MKVVTRPLAAVAIATVFLTTGNHELVQFRQQGHRSPGKPCRPQCALACGRSEIRGLGGAGSRLRRDREIVTRLEEAKGT
jgi:hypothetical protein